MRTPQVVISRSKDGKRLKASASFEAETDNAEMLYDIIDSFLAAVELICKDEQDEQNPQA